MKSKGISAFLLAFGLFFSFDSVAQENVAKFSPIGIYTMTNGYGVAYSIGGGFEHVFTDNISGQINIGGVFKNRFNSSFISNNRFEIKPEVAIYLLDYAPRSLYVGGFYSLALGSNGTLMSLGPQVGYQFFVWDEQLTVDVNFEAGVGLFLGGTWGNNVGFHSFTGATVGWAF